LTRFTLLKKVSSQLRFRMWKLPRSYRLSLIDTDSRSDGKETLVWFGRQPVVPTSVTKDIDSDLGIERILLPQFEWPVLESVLKPAFHLSSKLLNLSLRSQLFLQRIIEGPNNEATTALASFCSAHHRSLKTAIFSLAITPPKSRNSLE
jgi:hypothetical protein